MDAIRKIEHSDSEAMGFAIMEHLGPLALTHGHISPIDAFELGWKARAQTLASKEAELFDLRRIASLAGHIANNRDAKDWALMNLDISEAAELARKYFTRAALTQPTE